MGMNGTSTDVGTVKNTTSPQAERQQQRNVKPFRHDVVMKDSTTDELYGKICFAPSAEKVIERDIAGKHRTLPNKNSHTNNRGLDTLASDSRNDPLAGEDIKLEFPNAKNKADVRITEYGDFNTPKWNGAKKKPKGNVVRN